MSAFCNPVRCLVCVTIGWIVPLGSGLALAQEPATPPRSQPTGDAEAVPSAEAIEELAKYLTGVKLVGSFTISGQGNKQLRDEEYVITAAEKLPEGDLWKITARIKYGEHDLTVPLPLNIKWAGDTPVITVNNLTIPGLGTFDARVLIRQDAYAGTWKHGQVGGHLFGSITRLADDEK